MPILVNGEAIRQKLIQQDEQRLAQTQEWQAFPDGLEKQLHLRQAAEACAIDRILLRQEADKDRRPIDPALVASQVEDLIRRQSCRLFFDEGPLSKGIEGQLRLQ